MNDEGARNLYTMSRAAYDQALERRPFDAQWHAGYADLLGYYAYYAKFEGIDTRLEGTEALQEIKTALSLNPKDDKVREIADLLVFYLDGQIAKDGYGYAFPGLTATPKFFTSTPFETPTPEITDTTAAKIESTPTPVPITTPTELPKSDNKKSFPICGSAVLAPLGFLFIVKKKTH